MDIAKLLLPEVLVDYFKLTKHKIKHGELHFYFTELKTIPEEFKALKLSSKGFFPEATFKISLYVVRTFFYIL